MNHFFYLDKEIDGQALLNLNAYPDFLPKIHTIELKFQKMLLELSNGLIFLGL